MCDYTVCRGTVFPVRQQRPAQKKAPSAEERSWKQKKPKKIIDRGEGGQNYLMYSVICHGKTGTLYTAVSLRDTGEASKGEQQQAVEGQFVRQHA